MSERKAVREAIVVAFERVDFEELGRQLAEVLSGLADAIAHITSEIAQAIRQIRNCQKKRPPRCIGAPCVVYLKRARPCCRSNC